MSEHRPLRVLFIGIPDSVHVARWLRALDGANVERTLFPTSELPLHPLIAASDVRCLRIGKRDGYATVERALDVLARRTSFYPWRARAVAAAFRIGDFDAVHTLETQGAGYLWLAARAGLRHQPLWIHSNYGSDFFLFGRLPEHQARLGELARAVDFHVAECARDHALVDGFGFRGEHVGPIPNGAGLPLDRLQALRAGPPSTRRLIVLKGYQSWAGRALVGIEALRRLRHRLAGFSVKVVGATADVALATRLLALDGVDVTVVPYASQDEMLALHGRARVSIGVSISDAASTTFLEALSMGSFPVQSSTACCGEWIKDGVTGLVVDANDPASIAAAVERALDDDGLVDAAAVTNLETARRRLDERVVGPQVRELYARVRSRSGAR